MWHACGVAAPITSFFCASADVTVETSSFRRSAHAHSVCHSATRRTRHASMPARTALHRQRSELVCVLAARAEEPLVARLQRRRERPDRPVQRVDPITLRALQEHDLVLLALERRLERRDVVQQARDVAAARTRVRRGAASAAAATRQRRTGWHGGSGARMKRHHKFKYKIILVTRNRAVVAACGCGDRVWQRCRQVRRERQGHKRPQTSNQMLCGRSYHLNRS